MEQINFNEIIKKRIIIWTLCSIAGVISIPIMVIALVNGNWFIAIPFMAIVGFDVIALPIGWTFWEFL